MARRRERFNSEGRRPCLFVVEDDQATGPALTRWLRDLQIQSVLAVSTKEALMMIQDVAFIEASFDGLLVDYRLTDSTGCRVIQSFLEEFPGTPAALMTGYSDITLEWWVRSKGIPLFRKPLDLQALEKWLEEVVCPTSPQ